MTQYSKNSEDVSIIIPVYNDPEGVRATVESLCAQEYDSYQVLPVDNNSTDETNSVLEKFATQQSDLIDPVEEVTVQSSYAARNTGIKHATGEILLFLDADMWVSKNWVEEMTTTLESNDYDYMGCNVELVVNNQPNFWEQYEQSFSFPVETYLNDKHFAPTCALAVRREVFEAVGIFDERLESGGDEEFGQRVHRAGFKQGYAQNVTAYHPARDSWGALRSKAVRIGRGRAQRHELHPELGDPHPLHPLNYLPPSPFRLRRRFSGKDVSLTTLTSFYGIEYVLKLAQAYGMVTKWM